MLGLFVVLSVVTLGAIIGLGVHMAIAFHNRDTKREQRREEIKKRKREEEDARIKEELSKQEQKQTTAQNDDEEKLKWWYANMNMNLDEGAVECGFNMLQLYFASVNGATKPFKNKLNQLTRLNRYYK